MNAHRIVKLERLALSILGILIIGLLAQPILELLARVPKNYNEGWNAFHSARAFGLEALYPSSEHLFSNNYPPLSFYGIGGLGLLLGDSIIAGRLVALISLLIVAITIFLFLRWPLDCALTSSLLAPLMFLGYMSTHYRNYVAMNDPQMLGHAMQLSGVWLLWVTTIRIRDKCPPFFTFLALGLIFSSLLVKHNLLPIPLITAIWLMTSAKRHWLWVFLGIGVGCIGLCYGLYGPNFLSGILSHSREYQLVKMPDKLLNWLHPAFLWIIYGIWANWNSHKRHSWLVMLYFLVSLVLAIAIAGGKGVDYNAVFDVLISLSLLLGIGLDRSRPWLFSRFIQPRLGWILVLSLPVILALPYVGLVDEWKIFEAEKVSAAKVVDAISKTNGPVMCEMLALCYWADKPFEVDLFNTGQKMKTGAMAQATLIKLIERQYFAVIQLDHSNGSRRLPTDVNQAIFKYYQVRPPLPLEAIEHPAFLFYPLASEDL
ncbi:hypothetical protein [Leptothoe spongobia]|uniref:Uncharacterized protein n=1 Tax=Leptothoe spongobia TAU-MAC 1115 TaxID=1967444 RepID=A0A947GHW8_9CYAN|nr:hypothetical protein [Leptothoe spongobia]MBT9315264.1 hypothetical protein [Leptothoe spongobia TAU-MAC 1115]